jgi:hypothetical protein
VLYQLIFRSSATPGNVPAIANNFTLTNSPISVTGSGIQVSGDVQVSGRLIGDGSQLTNVPSSAGGTVSSVGLNAPASDFAVTGSPITGSGTLNLNWNVAPTNSNTPSAIVKRDINGGFSAGSITAAHFIGDGSMLTNLPGGGGGGGGTVTSVGLTAAVSDFVVTGSPVTGNGTLNLSWNNPPTSDNVPNAIVKRDPNGTVSIGTVIARQFNGQFIGDGSQLTNLPVSGGTVTSVGLVAPTSDFVVSGSPLTSNGTLSFGWNVTPTTTNFANAIVKRDASGNFSAGSITAFAAGTNAVGITAQGNGTGAGIIANGGASSGSGGAFNGGSPNGAGVVSFGIGQGAGMIGVGGGNSGTGISGSGGASSGTGGAFAGGAPNGVGVFATGVGAGAGVSGNGGSGGAPGVIGTGGGGNGNGVVGTGSGSGTGVVGNGGATNASGVVGNANGAAFGVIGNGGVLGNGGTGSPGVKGVGGSGGNGGSGGEFTGGSPSGFGILATGTGTGHAGHFIGNVFVAGNLTVTGVVSKGSGSFRIDDPLDPANKYLSHSFVESPDMMNIYNGNVITDQRGIAAVELPEYFSALNRDFRYQLTVIGEFAQAVVAEEIHDNRFTIRTNKPRVEVSWQVTGVRQDAYANAHRIPVEEDKPADERGHYLHPELFGQAEEKSVGWVQRPQQH